MISKSSCSARSDQNLDHDHDPFLQMEGHLGLQHGRVVDEAN